jgi:hypothetical protein
MAMMKTIIHMRIVQNGTSIRFFQMTGTGMAAMMSFSFAGVVGRKMFADSGCRWLSITNLWIVLK